MTEDLNSLLAQLYSASLTDATSFDEIAALMRAAGELIERLPDGQEKMELLGEWQRYLDGFALRFREYCGSFTPAIPADGVVGD